MAPRPLSVAAEEAFGAFWAAYPKRRPNPKVEARKAFGVQVDKGADPRELARAAESYAAECRRERIEPAYIPHARTWLHRERWRDYLGEAAEAAVPQWRHPELRARLVPPLSEADYVAWIEPLTIERRKGARGPVLYVACSSPSHLKRIRTSYAELLLAAAGLQEMTLMVEGRR